MSYDSKTNVYRDGEVRSQNSNQGPSEHEAGVPSLHEGTG
jgi:hypothetical protein